MPERCWYLLSKKLNGEATHAELIELQEWLHADALLAEQVAQITAFWQPVSQSPPQDEANELWKKHQARFNDVFPPNHASLPAVLPISSNARRFPFKTGWAVAALLVGVTFFIWLLKPATTSTPVVAASGQTFTTRATQKKKLTLPDGTLIWLNANSMLQYTAAFGNKVREVWLEGEAFFDVFENKEVPFIIHAPLMNIRVTGTSFNVRAYPAEAMAEAALVKGQIILTMEEDSTRSYTLKPNDKVRVQRRMPALEGAKNSQGKIVNQPQLPWLQYDAIKPSGLDSLPVEAAWTANRLEFDEETFRQVANKMEHWYGVRIVFTSPKLEQEILSGRFTNESLEKALTYLSYTTPFAFSIKDSLVSITPTKK
ncbi:MAG TPA: FecR family protein [Phnomibacter sp.]|nr:FecR family protein [Phnomibacter sp.]